MNPPNYETFGFLPDLTYTLQLNPPDHGLAKHLSNHRAHGSVSHHAYMNPPNYELFGCLPDLA